MVDIALAPPEATAFLVRRIRLGRAGVGRDEETQMSHLKTPSP
jgi:hypothetical protein